MGEALKGRQIRSAVERAAWGMLAGAILALGWGRWGDLFIDAGRAPNSAWRLSEGARAGIDVIDLYGPLPTQIVALFFRCFGASLPVYWLLNFGVALVAIDLNRACLLRMSDRGTAALGTFVFLALFVLGHYGFPGNYNFISPYAIEITYGFTLALAAVLYALRLADRVEKSGPRWGGLGLLLGLLSLTKPEVFVAGAVGSCVPFLVKPREERGSAWRRGLPWIGLGTAIPPALIFTCLAYQGGAASATRAVFGQFVYLASPAITRSSFYHRLTGWDDPGRNLCLSLAAFAAWAGMSATDGWIKARTMAAARGGISKKITIAALTLFVAFVTFRFDGWSFMPRALPWIGLVGVSRWARVRSDVEVRRRRAGLAYGCFAVCLLAKLFLHARLNFYGFVLAAPAVMALIVEGSRRAPFRCLGCVAGLTLGLTAYGLVASVHAWQSQDTPVVVDSATLWERPSYALYFGLLRGVIQREVPAGATLAVVPEGDLLNLATKHRTTLPVTVLVPFNVDLYGPEKIRNFILNAPPDYVLLIIRDLREYGKRGFGVDYAAEIMADLTEHYTVQSRQGPFPFRLDTPAYVLLRRK